MRAALLVALTLTACGAESPTPQTPTDASAPSGDCPTTRIGTVTLDGGACVYVCPGESVLCPGVGCEVLGGNPDHCGACGNRCTSNQRCDHAAGSREWFCRNNGQ